jgi:hypothetical protein
LIFAGLADDITWRQARVSISEISTMLYSNRNAAWTSLAPATRTVAEGASNAARLYTGDDMNLHILSLARIICHAEAAPELSPLLCLRTPDKGISLLEGHTRATAIVLEAHKLPRGVEAFIGESPSIKSWAYL